MTKRQISLPDLTVCCALLVLIVSNFRVTNYRDVAPFFEICAPLRVTFRELSSLPHTFCAAWPFWEIDDVGVRFLGISPCCNRNSQQIVWIAPFCLGDWKSSLLHSRWRLKESRAALDLWTLTLRQWSNYFSKSWMSGKYRHELGKRRRNFAGL
jgi:hypothetical protein